MRKEQNQLIVPVSFCSRFKVQRESASWLTLGLLGDASTGPIKGKSLVESVGPTDPRVIAWGCWLTKTREIQVR